VPGATYDRAYTRTDAGLSGTGSPATVGTFRLDKYSVTVGRFRTFVTAWDNGAGWYPPAGSGKHTHLNGGQGLVDSANDAGMTYEPGWIASDDGNVTPTAGMLLSCGGFSTWTASAGAQENLPIGCVNWYEAYAFCIWDGGFLPSEAEWEYAAAGGSQQLEYPWGSADPGTANQYGVYGCYYNGTGGMTCSGVSNIGAVGLATMGAGLWGQLDLTTNMSQWVLDWTAPFVTPCTDCASLTGGTSRVTRGGNYLSGEYEVVSSNRSTAEPPADRTSFYGFRCARTP
jgi:formylglycine-generating enzyme required for sulfatase activity